VRIRAARPGEEAALSALALRSKAHWGYDPDFLERARPELTLGAGDRERVQVRVAERDGRLVGFSALDPHADPPELVALFAEPDAIGTGVGRALLQRAREDAGAAGIEALVIESDPGAEAFYRSQGAVRIGERRSAGTGRALPLLRLPTR
jgi:GNAT superfamily N-acetyltransferase